MDTPADIVRDNLLYNTTSATHRGLHIVLYNKYIVSWRGIEEGCDQNDKCECQ